MLFCCTGIFAALFGSNLNFDMSTQSGLMLKLISMLGSAANLKIAELNGQDEPTMQSHTQDTCVISLKEMFKIF